MFEDPENFKKSLLAALERLPTQSFRPLQGRIQALKFAAPEMVTNHTARIGQLLVEQAPQDFFEQAMQEFEVFAPQWVKDLRAARP